MIDLDELEKLEKEAISDGPWWSEGSFIYAGHGPLVDVYDETDAALIVAARNALPEMIEELKNFMAIDEHDPFGQISGLKHELFEARRRAAMWRAATTIPPPPAAIP